MPVIGGESGLAPSFVESARADAGETISILKHHVFLEAIEGGRLDSEAAAGMLKTAHAFVLLCHFLDQASLQGVRQLYHRLKSVQDIPLGLFILRNPDEKQFKVSCPQCGQKLWIAEEEIGMRGRCVNCRHGWQIAAPAESVRHWLRLPDSVPVLNVTRGNTAGCRGALANLLARALPAMSNSNNRAASAEINQATIPIQIAGTSHS